MIGCRERLFCASSGRPTCNRTQWLQPLLAEAATVRGSGCKPTSSSSSGRGAVPTAAAVEELLPAWLAVSPWHVEHGDGEYGSAVERRVRGGAPSLQVRWTLRGLASRMSRMSCNAAIPNACQKRLPETLAWNQFRKQISRAELE